MIQYGEEMEGEIGLSGKYLGPLLNAFGTNLFL